MLEDVKACLFGAVLVLVMQLRCRHSVSVLELFIYFFVTLKGYWLRDNRNTLKNISLVARPCKEDSRRNRSMGWRFS